MSSPIVNANCKSNIALTLVADLANCQWLALWIWFEPISLVPIITLKDKTVTKGKILKPKLHSSFRFVWPGPLSLRSHDLATYHARNTKPFLTKFVFLRRSFLNLQQAGITPCCWVFMISICCIKGVNWERTPDAAWLMCVDNISDGSWAKHMFCSDIDHHGVDWPAKLVMALVVEHMSAATFSPWSIVRNLDNETVQF